MDVGAQEDHRRLGDLGQKQYRKFNIRELELGRWKGVYERMMQPHVAQT